MRDVDMASFVKRGECVPASPSICRDNSSPIGEAAGSSVTTVDQADMRALGSTRLLCVTELPRSRLWGVAAIAIQ